MNRTDKIREVLALEGIEAAAKRRSQQLRAELEQEARQQFEQDGTAVSWRVPDIAAVSLPISKTTPVVADPVLFTKWVATRYPTEVEQTTTVRPSFQAALFGRVELIADVTGSRDGGDQARVDWSQAKVYDTRDGEVIPGLAVKPGGLPQSLRFAPNPDAKAAYAAAGDVLLDQILAAADGPVVIPADGAQ